jgi:hypothetical protein
VGGIYRFSGRVTLPAIFISLVLVLVGAAVGGPLSGLASFHLGNLVTGMLSIEFPIPLIGELATILQLVPALVLVLVVAGAAAGSARLTHIRSPLVVAVLGLSGGVLGHYVGWSVWLALTFAESGLTTFDFLAPALFAEGVVAAAERQLTIFGMTTTFFNWIAWLAEGGVVVGLSVFVSRNLFAERPFCEPCGRWFTQVEEGRWFVADPDMEAVKNVLVGGHGEPLDLFVPIPVADVASGPAESGRFYRADLEYCSNCLESCTIDVEVVDFEPNGDAGGSGFKKHKTELIENLLVTGRQMQRLLNPDYTLDGDPEAAEPA